MYLQDTWARPCHMEYSSNKYSWTCVSEELIKSFSLQNIVVIPGEGPSDPGPPFCTADRESFFAPTPLFKHKQAHHHTKSCLY